MSDGLYYKLRDIVDLNDWPIASLVPDAIDAIRFSTPAVDAAESRVELGLFLDVELAIKIPGLDFLTLAIAPSGTGTVFDLAVEMSPFKFAIRDVPIVLRIDADVLHPVRTQADGSVEIIPDAKTLDITLATAGVSIDAEGHVAVEIPGGLTIPRCMIGSTGIILSIGSARWLTPTSPNLPPNTPAGFTGFAFDDATIEFEKLGIGTLAMDDVFIGNTGFSGKVSLSDDNLTWNPQGGANGDGGFEGKLVAELGGFDGAIKRIGIEFKQSALVGCDIEGCVYVPYIKSVIGLDIGLDGNGGFTAIAKAPACKFANGRVTE